MRMQGDARGCKGWKLTCGHLQPLATTSMLIEIKIQLKFEIRISKFQIQIIWNISISIKMQGDARGCKEWKLTCGHLQPLATSCIPLRPHRNKDTSQISDSDKLISDSNYLKNIDFYGDARGRKRLQALEIDVRPPATPWNLLRPLASS